MSVSPSTQPVHVDTVLADADAIPYGDFGAGMVFVPTGSTITTLTWYASSDKKGTFLAAQDASGNPIVQTVAAAKCYPIPADLAGARALKIVGNADGAVDVSLKG